MNARLYAVFSRDDGRILATFMEEWQARCHADSLSGTGNYGVVEYEIFNCRTIQ